MPCLDREVEDRLILKQNFRSVEKEYEAVRLQLEAALCASLGAFEKLGYDINTIPIDWEQSGIHKAWLFGWWIDHKQRDEYRKRQETEKARLEEMKREALAKLTSEERRALGL